MVTKDKTTRKQVSHFSIFDYWKDKAILENGEVVDGRHIPSQNYIRIMIDWGEPSCWACDKPILTTYEKNEVVEKDLSKIWSDRRVKAHLNRCHVVPRTRGGEDSPSNLFLMCPTCHKESPDTTNPRAFFRWVYDQRKTHAFGVWKMDVLQSKVQERLARRGINTLPEEMAKVINEDNLSYEKMAEYLESHIETHEFHYAESSMIEGFVDWLIHTYVEACLEG